MENELLKSVHKVYESAKSGTVYATDDVFVTVVGMAASDVEGVLGLSDLNTGEPCSKLTVRNLGKCLRLDFGPEQPAVILGIIVGAGYNLLEVSHGVQNKVLAAVRDMIGFELAQVNIQISDVRSK